MNNNKQEKCEIKRNEWGTKFDVIMGERKTRKISIINPCKSSFYHVFHLKTQEEEEGEKFKAMCMREELQVSSVSWNIQRTTSSKVAAWNFERAITINHCDDSFLANRQTFPFSRTFSDCGLQWEKREVLES